MVRVSSHVHRFNEQYGTQARTILELTQLLNIKNRKGEFYKKWTPKLNQIITELNNIHQQLLEAPLNQTTDIIINPKKIDIFSLFYILKPLMNNNTDILVGRQVNNQYLFASLFSNNGRLSDRAQTLAHGGVLERSENIGSDVSENIARLDETDELVLQIVKKENQRRRYGAFFDKMNVLDHIDLTRYGIYNEQDIEKGMNENCFIKCIEQQTEDIQLIAKAKDLFLKEGDVLSLTKIPKTKLYDFCKNTDCKINLSMQDATGYERNDTINKNGKGMTFKIGLLNNHFFINEQTRYTTTAINKYHKIINHFKFDETKWYKSNIVSDHKIQYFNNEDYPKITSFKLIQLLLKNNQFKEIPVANRNNHRNHFKPINFVEDEIIIHDNSRLLSYEKRKSTYNRYICILDTEAITHQTKYGKIYGKNEETRVLEKQQCYQCNALIFDHRSSDQIIFNISFDGENAFFKCLKAMDAEISKLEKNIIFKNIKQYNKNIKQLKEDFGIKKDTLVYIHNLKYDLGFLNYNDDYHITSTINAGTNVYSRSISRKLNQGKDGKYYQNGCFKLIDSLKLIPEKLAKFKDMFNLNVKKELMNYKIYTKENVEKRWIPIKEYCKEFNEKEHDIIRNNCIEWKCINDKDEMDIIEYSRRYCDIDLIVLKEGICKFAYSLKTCFDIDVHDYLTISSIGHNYFLQNEVYKYCCENKGVLREFIQKCVRGGRVMTRKNERFIVNSILQDFDAVSLYPSAMLRLTKELGGILKGSPKNIESENQFETMKNIWDGYFILIKINKLGIKRNFPLVGIYDGESLKYTNDLIGEYIHVDKIFLEDLVKFQKVEYEFVKGIYYDEGRDPKIGEMIESIFDERVKLKNAKNTLEKTYKLIMNSIYGKTIEKNHSDRNICFYSKESFMNGMDYHLFHMLGYSKKGEQYIVNVDQDINKSYNLNHIGCEILSMSKRIMNEVICLAEDNDIDIYYIDTDSMHLKEEEVPRLSRLFKEKYKRDLLVKEIKAEDEPDGKEKNYSKLGQFHCDFSIKRKDGNVKNVKSTKGYFIGKKIYLDLLEGELNGEIIKDMHVRLKGVSKRVLDNLKQNDPDKLIEIYEKMIKNEDIHFDLKFEEGVIQFLSINGENYTVLFACKDIHGVCDICEKTSDQRKLVNGVWKCKNCIKKG